MNLVFVVERPTQFEVPLYRHAATDPVHRLTVIYAAPGAAAAPFDPELGRRVDWGFDLFAGYEHRSLPTRARSAWLRRTYGELRPDLVIVNGYTRAPYLAAALAARRARLSTGLRIDSALFPGEEPSHPLLRRGLLRGLLPALFDLYFAVGTLGRRYLGRFGVPAARQRLFPYPVDVEMFRAGAAAAAPDRAAIRTELGVPAEARVVGSLSKHGPREGAADLLAAAELLADRQDLWFVLAGDGPDRPALEAAARAKGLDRVRFPGYMPYPTLPRYYAAIDCFVHCAREERWGVSVAEALAAGRPVVASSRVGAAYDLIEPGSNGEIYAVGDGAALAARLLAALEPRREPLTRANDERLQHVALEPVWRGLVAAARDLG